jgi:hypothetical protein
VTQPVGLNFKSLISTLGDDASIEEAFKVYHYGVANYSSQPIPNDSIEGNFRSLSQNTISRISFASSPNSIVSENSSTIPLNIRGFAGQTESLQRWQNSSGNMVAAISPVGYLGIGNNVMPTTVALDIRIGNSSHKGIVIRSSSLQNTNIQEWQNANGIPISWVDSEGRLYSRGDEVGTGIGSFFLMGA